MPTYVQYESRTPQVSDTDTAAAQLELVARPNLRGMFDTLLTTLSGGQADPLAPDRPLLSSPQSVIRHCGPLLETDDREHFIVLALDTKNRLILVSSVSVGTVDATVVHPREVYKAAIRCSAASVIVVHNHPSGDPQPSGADVRLTHRLRKAGEIIGIPLLDHVIVAPSGFGYSLREHGEMG